MSVVVRELTEGDDVDALGRIVLAAYRTLPGYPPEPDYEIELADVASRARVAVVAVAEAVAVADGGLVGCVTYVPDRANALAEFDDPDAASFRMLAVDPGVQRSGAGRAMVQWCIERARGDGKKRLVIHSGIWMTGAHALYERLGFVRRPDLDWLPVPEVHLLGYAIELAE